MQNQRPTIHYHWASYVLSKKQSYKLYFKYYHYLNLPFKQPGREQHQHCMAIPGIIRMCCYRPIQAALQSSTIYRVRLCFLLDVSLFTFTRGLTTKTNILFGIQKTIGTFRGKTNSTSFYLGNILQDIPGRLKFYWTPRRDETTKENTPNTEIYFPKPTYFPVRDNSCSGDRLRSISYFPSKSQDRAQKGVRHHMEWFVFLTSTLIALKTLVVPVSTDRTQSPWKGPAWEKRMFCTELAHVWASPAWEKLKFIITLVAK